MRSFPKTVLPLRGIAASAAILLAICGCGGAPPAPPPSVDSAAAVPIAAATGHDDALAWFRGTFVRVETGDYNHVIVSDENGEIRGFWGFPPLTEAEENRLREDALFESRPVIVGYTFERTEIPEAGGEMEIPIVAELSFPDVKDFRAVEAPDPAIFDEIIEAAARHAAAAALPQGRIAAPAFLGDEAWATAMAPDAKNPGKVLVQLRRREGRWVGAGHGAGLKPPAWYFSGSN